MKLYQNESMKANGILIFFSVPCLLFPEWKHKHDRVLSIENKVRGRMEYTLGGNVKTRLFVRRRAPATGPGSSAFIH